MVKDVIYYLTYLIIIVKSTIVNGKNGSIKKLL